MSSSSSSPPHVHNEAPPQKPGTDGERNRVGLAGIVAIFRDLDPQYDTKRVCIKIPSTWEGLQACRALEALRILPPWVTHLVGGGGVARPSEGKERSVSTKAAGPSGAGEKREKKHGWLGLGLGLMIAFPFPYPSTHWLKAPLIPGNRRSGVGSIHFRGS